MKTIHELVQGSESWIAFRNEHFGASESAAMLNISKHQTRAELLRRKATGISPEISPQLQAVFDRGHATEIGGRVMAQAIIGQELYPVTVSEGKLSASCDGLTMLEDIAFEHKQHNAALADSVRAGVLPDEHQPQCQQVMMLTGADKLLFMVSDGTSNNCAWMWVEPDNAWRSKIVQGWAQFEADLAEYVHTEQTVAPVAAPIEALPALAVTVSGSISLTHNLERFGQRLAAFVQDINTKPQTDQDFVNLDAAVKVLKEAEAALDSAESNALAQTATIADMCNLVAAYRKLARDNRLMFEKIVKQEKDNRRNEIVTQAMHALTEHVAGLNRRIGGNWVPPMHGMRFSDAVKGLKSLDSMRDKVAGALANAKIEANEIADRIEANRKVMEQLCDPILFPDFGQVCTKQTDDFAALVAMRVTLDEQRKEATKKAEEARIAAAVEAERKAGEARAAAAVEAERMVEAKRVSVAAANDQRGKADAGCGELEPQELRQQPETASTPPTPEEKRAAVVEAQDDIAAFMNARDFGKEPSKIRAILVEFVKFQAERRLKVAA